MNINDYVESPDIAAHCLRIGHEFSPLDIAVLVDLCDKPLKEKLTLWRTIIEECPDMPVHQSIWFSARESLHAYLRELIVWHEKALPTINKPGSHAAYRSKHIHAIREQMGRLSDAVSANRTR